MAFRLASAFVEVGVTDRQLKGGLAGVRGQLLSSFRSIGAALGITLSAAAAVGLGKMVVSAAANAEEVQSKFEAVFKQLTPDVEQFAENFARRIGRSTTETKRQLAEFQDLFVPLGFAREEGAELSKQLTELVADVASFNNRLDADVQRDFQSALVGNTETVRKYGIVITQTRLNQELLNMGIAGGVKQATEQQTVLARLNLILQGTTDAQGDAERTSSSYTNRVRALRGAIDDLSVEIGSIFLPVLAQSAGQMTDLVRATTEAVKQFQGLSAETTIFASQFGASLEILFKKTKLLGAELALLLDPKDIGKNILVNLLRGEIQALEIEMAVNANRVRQRLEEERKFGTDFTLPQRPSPTSDELRGFFGFDELARRIQEQTLKSKEDRQVELMEADQVLQRRMLQANEKIAENTNPRNNPLNDVGEADR